MVITQPGNFLFVAPQTHPQLPSPKVNKSPQWLWDFCKLLEARRGATHKISHKIISLMTINIYWRPPTPLIKVYQHLADPPTPFGISSVFISVSKPLFPHPPKSRSPHKQEGKANNTVYWQYIFHVAICKVNKAVMRDTINLLLKTEKTIICLDYGLSKPK